MQSKEDLEKEYAHADPWGYKTRDEDLRRREVVSGIANAYMQNPRFTLDIACGEGFITEALNGDVMYGYELSDAAASRWPKWLLRYSHDAKISNFDLVVCTGALYGHYDWQSMVDIIKKTACNTVVTCAIKDWEVPAAIKQIPGNQVFEAEFQYNPEDKRYIQKLRVFKL